MTWRPVALAALLALAVGPASAQRSGPETPPAPPELHPGLRPPGAPEAEQSPHVPGRGAELDCLACHQSKHQVVIRMYLGMGGRGTPMMPSHMFQVRVQCIACHVQPQQGEGAARLAGTTFKPSEQACLGCHGDKYRGMLQRWTDTGARMGEIVQPKIEAARTAVAAADPKHPRLARARQLLEDAEFNLQFARVGKGVHNVFFAAELVRLANGWTDESLALLGKPPIKADDTLVRGGYCAVLCHGQAGVKLPETVAFRAQRVPHARHVTEFGATCTACHSAEVHKAVTAKPATCTACHHSATNERCETCHRPQSAFYRGETKTDLAKLEPNIMVDAVPCTGCHDWSLKHSRGAVARKCVACHDKGYQATADEWTRGFDKAVAAAGEAVKRAEAAVVRERRSGRRPAEADALVKQARDALALVRKARGVHNPTGAEALLEAARKKAEAALARAAQK
jgi:hypothetical protein